MFVPPSHHHHHHDDVIFTSPHPPAPWSGSSSCHTPSQEYRIHTWERELSERQKGWEWGQKGERKMWECDKNDVRIWREWGQKGWEWCENEVKRDENDVRMRWEWGQKMGWACDKNEASSPYLCCAFRAEYPPTWPAVMSPHKSGESCQIMVKLIKWVENGWNMVSFQPFSPDSHPIHSPHSSSSIHLLENKAEKWVAPTSRSFTTNSLKSTGGPWWKKSVKRVKNSVYKERV